MKTATTKCSCSGAHRDLTESKRNEKLKDLILTVDTILQGDQHFNRIICLDSPSCPGQRWHNLTVLNGNLKVEEGIEIYSLDVKGNITAERIDSWRVTARNIKVAGEIRYRELHCKGKLIYGSLRTNSNGYELVLRSPDRLGREVTSDSLITNRSQYDVLLRDLAD